MNANLFVHHDKKNVFIIKIFIAFAFAQLFASLQTYLLHLVLLIVIIKSNKTFPRDKMPELR